MKGQTRSHAEETTPGLLLQAAKKLFAAHGFEATTIKMLAREAGVNVSLVSYHFAGKDGLLRACLESFSQGRLEHARRVLVTPKTLDEVKVRLGLFFEEILMCFVREPELLTIIHRELELGSTQTIALFKETFGNVREVFIQFLRASQKAGLLARDFDAEVLSAMAMGALVHQARHDFLTKKFSGNSIRTEDYRNTVSAMAVRMITEGFLVHKQEGRKKL